MMLAIKQTRNHHDNLLHDDNAHLWSGRRPQYWASRILKESDIDSDSDWTDIDDWNCQSAWLKLVVRPADHKTGSCHSVSAKFDSPCEAAKPCRGEDEYDVMSLQNLKHILHDSVVLNQCSCPSTVISELMYSNFCLLFCVLNLSKFCQNSA